MDRRRRRRWAVSARLRRVIASLAPLESTNLDLSFEWYYGESSYASVGYFRKAVNNFVGTGVIEHPLFGLQDPTSGAPGTLDRQCSGGPDSRRLSGERAEPVHHVSRPEQSGRLPEWCAADYIDPTSTTADGAQFALDMIAAL